MKKDKHLSIRLSSNEQKALKYQAKEQGTTVSKLLRNIALDSLQFQPTKQPKK